MNTSKTASTTKQPRKIAKGGTPKLLVVPRNRKAYSRKQLAEEILRLTGEVHNPGYLADIVNGVRKNNRLAHALEVAVANLNGKKK